jgi:hypothetical protein
VINIFLNASHSPVEPELGDQTFVWTTSVQPDKQGVIIAFKNNDQYLVKISGTGRLTLRNRRFLRKFERPQAPVLVENESGNQVARTTGNLPSAHQLVDRRGYTPTEGVNRVADTTTPCAPLVEADGELARGISQTESSPQALQKEIVSAEKEIPRRSNRARKQAQVYEAYTGKYMDPIS